MAEAATGLDQSLRISVVIPHLNQAEMLRQCLASIWNGNRRPDQVLVVDNGSTELPEAIVADYPGTLLLQDSTPGPGPARNCGIAASDGDVLAFIDADCLADPDWLKAAESALEISGEEILGGDVRIALADDQKLTVLEAYESVYAYRMDRYIKEQGFTGTGNLVVSRKILMAVGPFAGVGVAEDRDWGHRATALGFRIRFLDQMWVYHPARQSFGELYAKWDRQLAHDYAYARQNGLRGKARWFLKTLAMPVSPITEIPRILVSDRIAGPRSRALAFLGLARIRFYRMRRMAWLMAGGNPDTLSGRWNRNAA